MAHLMDLCDYVAIKRWSQDEINKLMALTKSYPIIHNGDPSAEDYEERKSETWEIISQRLKEFGYDRDAASVERKYRRINMENEVVNLERLSFEPSMLKYGRTKELTDCQRLLNSIRLHAQAIFEKLRTVEDLAAELTNLTKMPSDESIGDIREIVEATAGNMATVLMDESDETLPKNTNEYYRELFERERNEAMDLEQLDSESSDSYAQLPVLEDQILDEVENTVKELVILINITMYP